MNEINNHIQSLIDNFTMPAALLSYKNLTNIEEEELIETATLLIHELIIDDVMRYSSPNFHETIIAEVEELFEEQFKNLYTKYDITNNFGIQFIPTHETEPIERDNTEMDIRVEIHEIIEKAMNLFYRHISPRRSSGDTFIRITPNINMQRKKIEYLQSIPQPDQRTDAWYLFRHKFLTASSIWKAFGTQGSKNQLIYDKCKPINIDKYKYVCTDSAMHWGNKYEPLSILIYETKYNTKVSDFGCLPHKTIPYIAASPDGINTLDTSDRYGRMLEVKNIVNRDITGIPKTEYWIQMQVQMEVCNLNECDFLETRFKEYEEYEDFEKDGSFTETNNGSQKGVFMYFIKNGQPHYEYPLLNITLEEFNKWEEQMMEKNIEFTWMKNIYWKLDELSCVLVLRNKLWFKEAETILQGMWKTIEYEKLNGYEYRAPTKRARSNIYSKYNNNNDENAEKKCLINVKQLFSTGDDINTSFTD